MKMSIGQTLSKYVEPKGWDELKDKEKIERMREIVKEQGKQLSSKIRSLESQIEKLSKHYHLDNKVVVDYDRFGNIGGSLQMSESCSPNAKVFF